MDWTNFTGGAGAAFGIAITVLGLVVLLCALLLPVSIYALQKHTHGIRKAVERIADAVEIEVHGGRGQDRNRRKTRED